MSIPELEPGTYNLEISLDTKSKLGKISSKRAVELIKTNYEALQKEYIGSVIATGKDAAPDMAEKILNAASCETIKPGVTYTVTGADKCVTGVYPGEDKLSAVITWKPGGESLGLHAEVTDADFSVVKPGSDPEEGSSVSIHISPTGFIFDRFSVTVVPDGADGKARLTQGDRVFGEYYENQEGAESLESISATWRKTEKGYTLDVEIPWEKLTERAEGWNRQWTRLPVKVCVSSKGHKGKVQISTGLPGEPSEMFTYSTLLRK